MSGINYYQLLGLRATASDGEIRRAYLRLSLQYHPDKRRTPDADADELYRNIQEAYETLSCPEKRCLYNFVGCFAALAEVTASRPVAMPTNPNGWQQERRRAVATDFSPCNGLWSRSSSGDTLHSWGTASFSFASASRMSPSSVDSTNLSSSPVGIPSTSPASTSVSASISDYHNCTRSENLVNDSGALGLTSDASRTAGISGHTRPHIDLPQASTTGHGAATSSGIPLPSAVHQSQLHQSPFQRLQTETQIEEPHEAGSASVSQRPIVTASPQVLLSLPDGGRNDISDDMSDMPAPASSPRRPVAVGIPPPTLATAVAAAAAAAGGDSGGGWGGSSSPVTSPGSLLGKRRTPGGANDAQLHPHSPYRYSISPQPPSAASGDSTAAAAAGGGGGGSVCFSLPGGGGRRPASADVYHRLLLTLEEMYSGCVKQLRLARRVYQPPPAATGGLPSSPPSTAADGGILCELGAAAEDTTRVELAAAAPAAGGGGSSGGGGGGDVSGACAAWRSVEELFRVVVQPGWREGTKVTFPGKGDELPCGSRGDMVLVVAQAAHEQYERHGNDLHTVVIVPLVDALTGGDTAITTLDGRTIVLQLGPSCLQPFSEFVVKGEGMPQPPGKAKAARTGGGGGAAAVMDGAPTAAAAATTAAAAAARGDLRVRFEVSFPSDLTPEQKSELRRALLE